MDIGACGTNAAVGKAAGVRAVAATCTRGHCTHSQFKKSKVHSGMSLTRQQDPLIVLSLDPVHMPLSSPGKGGQSVSAPQAGTGSVSRKHCAVVPVCSSIRRLIPALHVRQSRTDERAVTTQTEGVLAVFSKMNEVSLSCHRKQRTVFFASDKIGAFK